MDASWPSRNAQPNWCGLTLKPIRISNKNAVANTPQSESFGCCAQAIRVTSIEPSTDEHVALTASVAWQSLAKCHNIVT